MESSTSFINTTDIYAGDQSSGLSGTLFIFFVYFFFHFLQLLPWCCIVFSLEMREKINLFCHSLNANTIKGLLHCPIWLDAWFGRASRLYLWSVFPFCCGDTDVFGVFFVFYSYDLIPVLYIRVPFMVVCLQIVVLTAVYVWFERFHFITLDTTCGEIMANLKRQTVELLIYTHGKLLNVHQTWFSGKTNPILKTVLEEMEMMAYPSNLMSKLAWKSSPLTVPGKCSLGHW